MSTWSLDDIPWHAFDRNKVDPVMLSLVKSACMVEYNGYDYARYLCEVFSDDEILIDAANAWAEEEVQHGQALRRWAEIADPNFNFEKSFHTFTTGYKLPTNVNASVRGSRSGELIARCMVEIGTSSYYSAIRDATDEPALKAVCAKIAADEFRHYKLFYTHLKRYLDREKPSLGKRLKVALQRVAESEDDELAYAFFAAHEKDSEEYSLDVYKNKYLACAYPLYRSDHVKRMTAMAFKAIGIKPHNPFTPFIGWLAWQMIRFRGARLKSTLQTV